MTINEPYISVGEEKLHVLRLDGHGLSIIRAALYELACDPRGLDDNDSWKHPVDAERLLLVLNSNSARTARDIETDRQRRADLDKESDRRDLILGRMREDHAEVYAEVEAEINVLFAPPPDPEPSDESATVPDAAVATHATDFDPESS